MFCYICITVVDIITKFQQFGICEYPVICSIWHSTDLFMNIACSQENNLKCNFEILFSMNMQSRTVKCLSRNLGVAINLYLLYSWNWRWAQHKASIKIQNWMNTLIIYGRPKSTILTYWTNLFDQVVSWLLWWSAGNLYPKLVWQEKEALEAAW